MLRLLLGKKNESHNNGVWLHLPAADKLLGDATVMLTRTNDPLHILEVESSVPNLNRYIKDGYNLERLNQLALQINKMSNREAAIFSGALDMESVNGLEDVMSIANNLQNYELFQDVTTPRELGIYLVESGNVDIHKSAWLYLDYERVAAEYESNNGGAYTNLGYVLKSDDTPTQTISKRRFGGGVTQNDRKLLQKLWQKKIAQGHARDDHAPKQTY